MHGAARRRSSTTARGGRGSTARAARTCCAATAWAKPSASCSRAVARAVLERRPRRPARTSSITPHAYWPEPAAAPTWRRRRSADAARPGPTRTSTCRRSRCANGLGGFADGRPRLRRSCSTATQETPLPWANVIANPGFGTIVTASGSAYTWAENSRENRLTPFANDPVDRSDRRGALHPRRRDGRGVVADAGSDAPDARERPLRHPPRGRAGNRLRLGRGDFRPRRASLAGLVPAVRRATRYPDRFAQGVAQGQAGTVTGWPSGSTAPPGPDGPSPGPAATGAATPAVTLTPRAGRAGRRLSRDGHQFQRPRSTTVDRTSTLRTTKVSISTPSQTASRRRGSLGTPEPRPPTIAKTANVPASTIPGRRDRGSGHRDGPAHRLTERVSGALPPGSGSSPGCCSPPRARAGR